MRIFVAGATGTLGRPTVRTLASHGHEVAGLTRSRERAGIVTAAGARAFVGDALDPEGMRTVLRDARPEVVVHLLTAIPPGGVTRAAQLRPTNTLRIDGTASLLEAAIETGVRRIVGESFVAVYGDLSADRPVGEEVPLPPVRGGSYAEAVIAMRSLEEQLRTAHERRQIEAVALRIGLLYGADVPATTAMIAQARARRLFLPRGMSGIGSLVHVHDAAAAIVAAVEAPAPSFVYNVVDDEPIALGMFVKLLTEAIGAPEPRRVPDFVVRLAAPLVAALASAQLPLSNTRAKRELGWSLRYPTVREGLREVARGLAVAA